MATQTIYPALRYDDAPAAITWLERAFGFAAEHVYPGEPGKIAHAQLRAGRDLIMLGSTTADNVSPKSLSGRGTLGLYLRVAGVESLYARAQAASATIVRPLTRVDYDDSQTFTALDCEGYVWAFGGYAATSQSDLSACLRYEDAPRAIAWLCDTCGFGQKLIVPGDDGSIAHAELTFGDDVLMIGSRRDDDLSYDTPARTRTTTGALYVYTADVDALYARVRKAGARIVREVEDLDYGSREFGVRDPEGQMLTFGTYRP